MLICGCCAAVCAWLVMRWVGWVMRELTQSIARALSIFYIRVPWETTTGCFRKTKIGTNGCFMKTKTTGWWIRPDLLGSLLALRNWPRVWLSLLGGREVELMLVCSLLTELRMQQKMERSACEYFQSRHVEKRELGKFVFSFSLWLLNLLESSSCSSFKLPSC
jgi:hypothetical protein